MKNYNRGKIEVIASTCCNLPSACTGTGTGRMVWTPGEETRNTARAGRSHTQFTHARTPRQKQRAVCKCNCNLGSCRFHFSRAVYSKAYVASLIPFPLSSSSSSRPRRSPSVIPVIRAGNGNWQMGGAVVGGRWERHFPSLSFVPCLPTSCLLRPPASTWGPTAPVGLSLSFRV